MSGLYANLNPGTGRANPKKMWGIFLTNIYTYGWLSTVIIYYNSTFILKFTYLER